MHSWQESQPTPTALLNTLKNIFTYIFNRNSKKKIWLQINVRVLHLIRLWAWRKYVCERGEKKDKSILSLLFRQTIFMKRGESSREANERNLYKKGERIEKCRVWVTKIPRVRRSIQLNYSYLSCSGPLPLHLPANPVVGQGNKPRQLTINHRCLLRHWNDVKHCICVIVHLFQSLGCHLTNCKPSVYRTLQPPTSRVPFSPSSRASGRVAMPPHSTHFPVNRERIVAGYIN